MLWMIIGALAVLFPALLLLEFGYSKPDSQTETDALVDPGLMTLLLTKLLLKLGHKKAPQTAVLISGWALVALALLIVGAGFAGMRL